MKKPKQQPPPEPNDMPATVFLGPEGLARVRPLRPFPLAEAVGNLVLASKGRLLVEGE